MHSRASGLRFHTRCRSALICCALVVGCEQQAPLPKESLQPSSARLQQPDLIPSIDNNESLRANCLLRPASVLKVKSQASGEVLRVNVNPGDRVRVGDVLLEVSTRDIGTQLQRLEIAHQRITTRINILEMQIDRANREAAATKSLYSSAYLGKEALSAKEKQLDLEHLKLEIADVELQRKELIRQRNQSQIRATMDSTVITRNVEPGQVISAAFGQASGGDVLLELGDTNKLVLECVVHQSDALAIAPATRLSVTVPSERNSQHAAKVISLSPSIETANGIAQFRFTAHWEGAQPEGVLTGMRLLAVVRRAAGSSSYQGK
jgi:multidrug efflux pump subunit AcrA (membrane-fusion protein)